METLRHILQWAVPALISILLLIGTFKESKKAKSLDPHNGPCSAYSIFVLILALLVGVVGLVKWLYLS